jgi:hypothetical protein
MEYSKQVFDTGNENYKHNLLEFINDKFIWDTVFYKAHDLLNYYLQINAIDELSYPQNRSSTVYEQFTFQQFIDEKVNFQIIGYREYQKFMKSMQDPIFKAKMFDKYQQDNNTKTLKNHLVYVINLYLTKQIWSSTMFSPEEEEDIDFMINAIPYFEYISQNGWSLDQIDSGEIHIDVDQPVSYVTFNALEAKVLQKINKSF